MGWSSGLQHYCILYFWCVEVAKYMSAMNWGSNIFIFLTLPIFIRFHNLRHVFIPEHSKLHRKFLSFALTFLAFRDLLIFREQNGFSRTIGNIANVSDFPLQNTCHFLSIHVASRNSVFVCYVSKLLELPRTFWKSRENSGMDAKAPAFVLKILELQRKSGDLANMQDMSRTF